MSICTRFLLYRLWQVLLIQQVFIFSSERKNKFVDSQLKFRFTIVADEFPSSPSFSLAF